MKNLGNEAILGYLLVDLFSLLSRKTKYRNYIVRRNKIVVTIGA